MGPMLREEAELRRKIQERRRRKQKLSEKKGRHKYLGSVNDGQKQERLFRNLRNLLESTQLSDLSASIQHMPNSLKYMLEFIGKLHDTTNQRKFGGKEIFELIRTRLGGSDGKSDGRSNGKSDGNLRANNNNSNNSNQQLLADLLELFGSLGDQSGIAMQGRRWEELSSANLGQREHLQHRYSN
jgi:hypothetical protein